MYQIVSAQTSGELSCNNYLAKYIISVVIWVSAVSIE